MNYKKTLLYFMIIGLFFGFVYAQEKPENPSVSISLVCSNTPRTQATPQTYQTMYNPSDFQKKYFKDVDWNKSIPGAEARYDNTRSIQDSCKEGFYEGELGGRNNFWDKYFNVYKIFFPINESRNQPVFYQPQNIGKMQSYIMWACGLNIGKDGKLGKKTVNAVQVCSRPPAGGKLSRDSFQALAEAKALFIDAQGKTPIYSGTVFDNNFKADDIYVDVDNSLAKSKGITDQASASNKGLKLVVKDSNNGCQIKFGSFYNQVQNDVKLEGTNCCYFGNKDGKTVGVTSPNADQWSINGTNAIYSPILNTQATPIVIQNNTSSITVPLCNTTTSNDTCRFAEPKNDNDKSTYTAALADEKNYIKGSCSTGCPNNTKEVMKGGSSVCEICDIEKCNCGIKLNTYVPFIGRCIVNKQDNNSSLSGGVTTVNSLNAFPILMGALIKLLMSIIMILCFASLIVGGFMMTIPDQYETGKGLVKKVVWTIVALGSLGTILYLINPNFFT